jgi:cobalt-zinc-cadmium efflux system outer membrane protein
VAIAEEACKIRNIENFYSRVKASGPLLNEASKRKEKVSTSVDIAQQRPNPELDLEYLRGDEFGLEVNTYSLTAKHIIELGSKRDKRIEKAQSYKKLMESEVDLSLFNSNLNATIGYQRVAQLNITIVAVKEAIQTFDKINKKLSSRKRLNPEETVSLSTLQLASNDYKARLNDLENEKTLLEGKLSFLSNCKSIEASYKDLDYKNIKFERIDVVKTGLIALEDLKVEVEAGELGIQNSIGYSNLAVGPTFQYQGQGSDEFLSAGISLSFALPIFQTNDGGKINAVKSLAAQKIQSKNQKEMLRIERSNLITKFNRSLKTLSGMPNLSELDRDHRKVEKLFSRGVVSISMTIESHRQQIEFLSSRFETENDVLNTYGKIILIDGNITAFEKLL